MGRSLAPLQALGTNRRCQRASPFEDEDDDEDEYEAHPPFFPTRFFPNAR
jgi:hypothetical protein